MKTTFDKKVDRLEKKIRRQLDGRLDSGRFWFRGLSLAALESLLTFFIPETSGVNRDNEFGPGFYTTDKLKVSLDYLPHGGAVMVFKDPNLFRAKVWQPSLDDWTAWVARRIGLPSSIASREVPVEYQCADFIEGPIRETQTRDRRGALPQQSKENQLVGVSYQGCQILSDSLYLIILLTVAECFAVSEFCIFIQGFERYTTGDFIFTLFLPGSIIRLQLLENSD